MKFKKFKIKKSNGINRKINTRYLKLLYLLKWDIKNNFQNFDIFYQPQVNTKTGKTEEWRHFFVGIVKSLE